MDPLRLAILFVLPGRWANRREPLHRSHVDDVRFFVPTEHLPTAEHVLVRREYGVVRRLLAGHVQPKVIDAGAHIGMFSVEVLRHVPSATVHALEPNPRVYPLLDRNRAANPTLNWRTYHAALWSDTGEVGFHAERLATRSAVVAGGEQRVPSIALSDLLREIGEGGKVDLLKLDVEGAEEAILTAGEPLLATIAHVLVQVHPGRVDVPRVKALLGRNFEHLYRIPGERSNPLLLASRMAYDLPPEAS